MPLHSPSEGFRWRQSRPCKLWLSRHKKITGCPSWPSGGRYWNHLSKQHSQVCPKRRGGEEGGDRNSLLLEVSVITFPSVQSSLFNRISASGLDVFTWPLNRALHKVWSTSRLVPLEWEELFSRLTIHMTSLKHYIPYGLGHVAGWERVAELSPLPCPGLGSFDLLPESSWTCALSVHVKIERYA